MTAMKSLLTYLDATLEMADRAYREEICERVDADDRLRLLRRTSLMRTHLDRIESSLAANAQDWLRAQQMALRQP